MSSDFSPENSLRLARETLLIEASAVQALAERIEREPLAGAFTQAIRALLECRGRVVVSGMGKSGHVARKLAATLASTGTPAYFVHPAEASHGDLGMVTEQDVFIALSNSAEVEELTRIVPLVKRMGTRLIAITGRADSTLARYADIHLDCAVEREACPLRLAPTATTTAQLALGDTLAVAVLDARGFGADDFARTHPGGALGRRLLTHVSDVMRTGERVPQVGESVPFSDALLEMTRKGLGMTAVVDERSRLRGVITDGDLRRLVERGVDLRGLSAGEAMHPNPRTIPAQALAVEAVQRMERHRISQMLVVDEQQHVIGALHMHDLFAAKVV